VLESVDVPLPPDDLHAHSGGFRASGPAAAVPASTLVDATPGPAGPAEVEHEAGAPLAGEVVAEAAAPPAAAPAPAPAAVLGRKSG
jgi:hypothetical protein